MTLRSEHREALADLDRRIASGRPWLPKEPPIPPVTTERLMKLSEDMKAAGWPFPVEETPQRLASQERAA